MLLRPLALAAACLAAITLHADDIPQFRFALIASHLDKPVGIFDDGTGRIFVIEQDGRIQIVENGRPGPEPFLDIHGEVSRAGNECGLLGLAFHPRFARNHKFYLNYDTEKYGRLQTIIAEFTADLSNSRADPASERELMRYDQPYTNHKGGCMIFGPDHKLYIGAGDGGSAGDPHDNAQNLGVLLGKIMRIDVDAARPYAIPPDNPFAGRPGARGEIWCWGMRNPWRFSFDRQTHELWCGDVGQDLWEEVDLIEKGKNYGWSAREGAHDFKPARARGPLVDPVKEYGHDEGRCIIGGYVYRGSAIPALQGMYLYADYTDGWIAGFRYAGGRLTFDSNLVQTPLHIASFGEGHDGEIYVCDRERGQVLELAP